MKIEMGESLFYSWLRHAKGCQIVQNNWKVSSQWSLMHEDELTEIKKQTETYFKTKYNYDIYKGNASLNQIIYQGECDALGLLIDESGERNVYAVDIAFHENGLNYGSKDVTTMKVINKCLRTAMCVYGFMDINSAEIIFASPKINNNVLELLRPCINEAQEILNKLGYKFTLRLIANEDFKYKILDAVLMVSDSVADTNELFLRSYQLLNMFTNTSVARGGLDTAAASIARNEIKIGKLAQSEIPRILNSGKVSRDEINMMLNKEYSKETFGLNYPVLARIDDNYDKIRYYSTEIEINGEKYVLCSQWFETSSNNDRPYLEKWIQAHE